MKNKLKEKLKGGQVALGVAASISNPDVVEIISSLSFDWIFFDTEHSPLNFDNIQFLMQAIKGPAAPIIRVTWNEVWLIKRALDIGAHGVIVPWVNTREDAVKAARSCKYPPHGLRGVGPRRPVSLLGEDRLEYMNTADEEILVAVQIETRGALNNVDDILAVEGIDAFMIGPADLSTSLGIPFQFDHPELIAALDRVLEAAKRADVIPGMFMPSLDAAEKLISKGFQLVCLASDVSLLKSGLISALNRMSKFRT